MLDILQPVLTNIGVALVTALLSVLGVFAINWIAKSKDYVISKIGQTNYDKALMIAKGLYYVLEEQFANIEKSGVQKKAQMENYLLQLFPSLTQIELDAINKTVCEEVKAAAVAAGLTTTTTKTIVTNDEAVPDTTTTIVETKEIAVKTEPLSSKDTQHVVINPPQTQPVVGNPVAETLIIEQPITENKIETPVV